MAEQVGNYGEGVMDGTIRLLDERHPDDPRVCVKCLGAVNRETYDSTNFVCWPCDADWETYPWKTTHTTGQLAP